MAKTLAELTALDAEELKTMGDRAAKAWEDGMRVDEDDLAAAALLRPDLYDIKAGEDGLPVIHAR